jgi:sugar O-acyltransferase (sialic acid O-acetyltransferase NeuD family)
MGDLYIFGAGQVAEVAHYYFAQVSPRREIRFVVDDNHLLETSLDGIPIISMTEALSMADSEDDAWFTGISYKGRNSIRQRKADELSAHGFKFDSYVHPSAQCWSGFTIPANSMILENNVFQLKSSLGDNSIVWSNNHIGHHTSIGRNTFIASEVVISGSCAVGDNCFFGVNSSVIDGLTLGDSVVVGAGAILKESAPSRTVVR